MTSLDFLYISLGVGFLILVSAGVFLINQLVKTLEVLRHVLADVEDTTHDVNALKNSLKFGSLTIVSKLLGVVGKKL